MEISIFGYSLDLEVLILIGVVYLILLLNNFGSCCNVPKIMETMTDMATAKRINVSLEK